MTDFTKILDKAKELEAKMKESQEKIKEIRAEGVSGSNSIKIILDGEGELQNIELSDEIIKEDKTILLFLPKDKNKGNVLRNKGYTESVISSSEYLIDENENLNIKTIYSSTVSEERICFLSNHIRSRYSVIRNYQNNTVIQTSHTSEIRNMSILKD